MKDYVIFLRGINVGGKNMLPMKELRSLLEANGLGNVRSYIQSGNILAKSQHISSSKIGSLIESQFGFSPDIMILEISDFFKSIDNNPFLSPDGKTVHFYFCERVPTIDKEKIEKYADKSEEYEIHGNVFYLHAPNGIGRSKLVSNLESCLNTRATGRNLNTIRKMQELWNDA